MLLDRRPRQLSGGQRQRVALARAIVREPQVFLMDEPLSNLDAQLRSQMRVEIKRLQRELGATTLYVTHDQVEAMTMADPIAVMRDGRAAAAGAARPSSTPDPANLFVARFCGSPPMNVPARRRRRAAPSRTPPATSACAGRRRARPGGARLPPRARDARRAGHRRCARRRDLRRRAARQRDAGRGRGGRELVNVRAAAEFTAAIGERCAVRPDCRPLPPLRRGRRGEAPRRAGRYRGGSPSRGIPWQNRLQGGADD